MSVISGLYYTISVDEIMFKTIGLFPKAIMSKEEITKRINNLYLIKRSIYTYIRINDDQVYRIGFINGKYFVCENDHSHFNSKLGFSSNPEVAANEKYFIDLLF
jgi:hypothetical protein